MAEQTSAEQTAASRQVARLPWLDTVVRTAFLPAYRSQLHGLPPVPGQIGTQTAMLFMVIEHFKGRDARAVYARFRDHGRMAPDGVVYVGSWIEANFDRCFQLMECQDASLLQAWILNWADLVDFEIVPVVPSPETAEIVGRRL